MAAGACIRALILHNLSKTDEPPAVVNPLRFSVSAEKISALPRYHEPNEIFYNDAGFRGPSSRSGAAPTANPNPVPAAPAVDPDTVVLTIGDRHLTAREYEALIKTLLPVDQQAAALGAGRRTIAQRLIGMFVLSAEAVKQNLDKRPDIALQLAFQRETFSKPRCLRRWLRPLLFPTPTFRRTMTRTRTISSRSRRGTS